MNWKSIAVTLVTMVVALFIYDFVSSKISSYEEDYEG